MFKRLCHFLQQPLLNELREEVKRRKAAQEEIRSLKAVLEEKLREQTRLIEVQRIAHLGNWEWDVVNNVLDWSDEIYHIFGLTPQAFGATYEAFLRAVHPADRQLVDSKVREAQELGRPYSMDHRILRPDGTVRHVHERAEVSRNEAGRVIKMAGTVQDITDAKQIELSLLESEERFRKAFQNSVIGMALVGMDGHWLKVNNSLCQMLGYSEQELLSKTFQDITHPDDLQSSRDFLAQLLAGELDHFQMEKRYFHQDGHVVWIRLSVSLIRDAQENPIHFVTQIEDITEDKLATEALHKANIELSLFRKLLDNSSDAIEVIDPITARFLDVNETACRELGYSREELLAMSVFDIDPSLSQDGREMVDERIRRFGTTRFEGIHRRKDGSTFAVETSLSAANLDKPYLLSVVRDITERKRAEEEIYLLATTDSLTGIANRRQFATLLAGEMERATRYGTPMSVVMCDIDYFKRVNDTFGHDAGDAVLQALTALVKENIRANDIVARWGGEEFMVLMPQSDLAAAQDASEKLRLAIAAHHFDKYDKLTVSFGVTAFEPQDDLNSLLKRVDDALYRAKTQGRNRVECLTGAQAST